MKGLGNMLVSRTGSKRQRRPNVRLEEIGDVPAALFNKANVNLGEKKWKNEPKEVVLVPNAVFCGKMSTGLLVSDGNALQKSAVDTFQNRENRNPNSSKMSSELVVFDEADGSKSAVDFGIVTRKGRIMKRRGRSMIAGSNVTSKVWNCKVTSESNDENGEGNRGNDLVDPTTDTYDVYNFKDFKGSSGLENSGTSKEDHENECLEPISAVQVCSDQNEFGKKKACVEGDTLYSDDDPFVNTKSGVEYDKRGVNGSVVNCVRKWLEEFGFGKYAGIFEMHEVDQEALPLLTFEDLKDMGINAVGPRRKLYTAIQQLREGEGTP